MFGINPKFRTLFSKTVIPSFQYALQNCTGSTDGTKALQWPHIPKNQFHPRIDVWAYQNLLFPLFL
jgi:hypothetical protein